MENEIINFIQEVIHGGRGNLNIQQEDDLLSSGLLGSMEMVRVIEFIETSFGIKVAPQDMTIDNFVTVAAMCNYIASVKV